MNSKERDLIYGFDLGVASVGSAATDILNQEILHGGSHIWDASQDRLGRTLCSVRREYRSHRRVNSRKAKRKEQIKRIFIENSLFNREEIDEILATQSKIDVYQLRLDALDRLISKEELLRIFVKLAKSRGFKSNRKSDRNEKELLKLEESIKNGKDVATSTSEGVMNSAIHLNEKIMKEFKYRTAGEMLMKHPNFKDKKKNTGGTYLVTLSRELILDEAKTILETQKSLGNKNISDSFIDSILEVISKQRPFAKGEDIVKMVGKCSFEGDNKTLDKIEYLRSPKTTFAAANFLIWQGLNNTQLINEDNKYIPLTQEQKELVANKILSSSGATTYKNLRTYLKLNDKVRFKGLTYNEAIKKDDKFIQLSEKEILKEAENKNFINISEFLKIRKQLAPFNLSEEKLDIIGWVLNYYKTDEDIIKELSKHDLSPDVINAATEIIISSSKPIHIGVKALRNINKGLVKGLTYDKACDEAGYDFRCQGNDKEKHKFLPMIPKDEIINPTVFKTLCRARNILNALIEKYGSPSAIVIESARELAHSKKVKAKIDRENKKREALYKSYENIIKELSPDIIIKGSHLKKIALWKEQNERCVYTGKYIDLESLLHDDNLCQIDHILPYSRSWDNSHMNKVLVYAGANQEKGNKTPFEWLGSNEHNWNLFVERVTSNPNIPYKKKLNLLNVNYDDSDKGFLNRNLTDTAYASTYFAKFVSENLLFAESNRKKKVITVNGAVTANVRRSMKLEKDRSEHIHHAVDAMILTAIDESYIKKVSEYNKFIEVSGKKFAKNKGVSFPMPWDNFNYMVEKKADEAIVSKLENLKEKGALHEDTLYSYHGENELGYMVYSKNIPVSKLKIKVDTIGYDGMILKESHPLYNVIKDALVSGKSLDSLTTPSKGGTPNPVKNVKLFGELKCGNYTVLQNGKGVKIGGSLIRGDLYKKDGKYYCVPVYASDINNKNFVKKAMKLGKSKRYWTPIDESFNFEFSIRKNTLVKVSVLRRGAEQPEELIGYCEPGINPFAGRFVIIDLNGREHAIPILSIANIEKINIDILGDIKPLD